MSLFRRAGAGIARFVERVGNPGALADRLALYSKDDGGVSHLFAQVSDGTVYQLTPPANAVWRFTLGPIQDIPDAVTSFAPTTTYHRFTVSGGNQNIVAIPTIVWPSAVAGQLVVLHNVTPSGGNWVRLNRGGGGRGACPV